MLSGPRLDPFSARLHAIHQKGRTFNPPPHEEHDAQGLGDEADVGEHAAADEPVLDLAPVEAAGTGCADCGGMGNKKSDPVQELRTEIAAIKQRLAELEAAVDSVTKSVVELEMP
jgi:hypothetical protein